MVPSAVKYSVGLAGAGGYSGSSRGRVQEGPADNVCRFGAVANNDLIAGDGLVYVVVIEINSCAGAGNVLGEPDVKVYNVVIIVLPIVFLEKVFLAVGGIDPGMAGLGTDVREVTRRGAYVFLIGPGEIGVFVIGIGNDVCNAGSLMVDCKFGYNRAACTADRLSSGEVGAEVTHNTNDPCFIRCEGRNSERTADDSQGKHEC